MAFGDEVRLPSDSVEFKGHVVVTQMSDRAYEAACSCGWVAKPHENWVLVSSSIVAHFNQHLLD